MKFWQRDISSWRKKTSSLSYEEQGAYAAMLDAYYANESALPPDKLGLYRLVGAMSKKDQAAIDRVLDKGFFHENGGSLHNARADEELKKYHLYCEAQRRRRLGFKK